MNRRQFLEAGIAAGICSTHGDIVSPLLLGEEPLTESNAHPIPAWFDTTPIVVAGCWDDFPLYQKRRGGGCVWLDDLYRQQSAPSTVKALKDAGITLAILHFFKGFGLQAERDHIHVEAVEEGDHRAEED